MAGVEDCGLVVCAVGDVLIDRPDPDTAFEPSREILQSGDVLFGNCEAVYSPRPSRAPSASIPTLQDPKNLSGLAYAGFDVMSLANNHSVDGGHVGLIDTLKALHDLNILTCGAGGDFEDAVKPALIERKGRRVAFLAYCCSGVHPAGYESREGIPGIASVRTHTVYYPSDLSAFQSGAPPEQFTVVNPKDLRRVQGQIADACETADIVLVSIHAGDGAQPGILVEYERQLAQASVDAGADAVLGHHHHMLRGVDLYRGRPIFYGLSHFVFDCPSLDKQIPPSVFARLGDAGEYGYGPREGYPLLPMHPDARMTVMARVEFKDEGCVAGVVPFMINPHGQPLPLSLASHEGQKVLAYLEWLNEEAGFATRWEQKTTAEGHSFLVLTPAEETRTAGLRKEHVNDAH